MLQVLKIIACVATIGTGLIALLKPRSLDGFTGLVAPGPRGVTELRAVMGGFFIALGAAPLVLGVDETFVMLGIAYLVVALVRGVSIVVDGSSERSNWISLFVEIVLGLILIW